MKNFGHERPRLRWQLPALGLTVSALTLVALLLMRTSGDGGTKRSVKALPVTETASAAIKDPSSAFPTVGVRVMHLYDGSRKRSVLTIVLYPAEATRSVESVADARPRGGPYPLIVFGHGFAVTPTPYRSLLDRWVRAGYVVAAPIFPKGNANAPGGPNERDLPNQPADMNFVIRKMRELSRSTGSLAGLLTPRVAVTGQSDGGDTALAAAFDPVDHVLPIDAAIILSGAEDPFAAPFKPQPGTPLLATQGTADTINRPEETLSFFHAASPPKFLLLLDGAEHQLPYTVPGPALDSVARVTIAFLDRYLKLSGAALRRLLEQGNAGASTELRGKQ